MVVVGIDPGHGGIDPGATRPWFPLTESEYNMGLARHLHNMIKAITRGVTPVLLRVADNQALSLDERGELSRQHECDLVIHIHVNAYTENSLHGGLVFHWPGNKAGELIGNTIARALPLGLYKQAQTSITATDNPTPDDDWLQRPRDVMLPHSCTTVLLECGYMSNEEDAAALMQVGTQWGLVLAMLCGINEYRRTYNGQ